MSSTSSDLRTILSGAVYAYELARVEYERLTSEQEEAHQTKLAQLDSTQSAAVNEAQAAQVREATVFQAEQQRINDLLNLVEVVARSASDLLKKAGMAHILGAPPSITATPAPERRDETTVAAAFAEAQTAFVDLRLNLYRLAAAFVREGRWSDAQRLAEPLTEDALAPLYADACDLICDGYFAQGSDMWYANKKPAACTIFEQTLCFIDMHREKAPAAAQAASRWLRTRGYDAEIKQALCSMHLVLGEQAVDKHEWLRTRAHVRAMNAVIPASPEGKRLIEKVPVWYRGQMQCVGILRHSHAVRRIVFSKDGTMLASATYAHVSIWDIQSLREEVEIPLDQAHYISSDDSMSVSAITSDGKPDIEITSFSKNTIFGLHHHNRYGQNYSNPIFWKRGDSMLTIRFSTESERKEDVAVATLNTSPSGRFKIHKSKSEIIVCDDYDEEIVRATHSSQINAFALSPNEDILATAGQDGLIRLWKPTTGAE